MVWLLTAVNCRGTLGAGRVQLVTTALKILPLLLIGIAGTLAFEPSHFSLTGVEGGVGKSVLATVTLTLWAFLGLESATVPAGSTADARRTIPRATVIGTLLAAAIYLLSTDRRDEPARSRRRWPRRRHRLPTRRECSPATARRRSSRSARRFRVSARLNGWVLVVGQLPMAVAEDGLFPRAFARLSSRGTPAFAMIVGAALSTALVAMNYSRGLVELFTFIILLATLSTLVPYTFCSLAGVILHRREREHDVVERRVDRVRPGLPVRALCHRRRRPGRRLLGLSAAAGRATGLCVDREISWFRVHGSGFTVQGSGFRVRVPVNSDVNSEP